MSIRTSSSKHIDILIRDLAAGDEIVRDAAIARLTVIGARCVDRLTALADSRADSAVRAAALRALEGIADQRCLAASLRAVSDTDIVVADAAIAAVRPFLRGSKGTAVVDRLAAVALDGSRPDALRAAAISALRDLEPQTIAPLLKTLSDDSSPAVRRLAARGGQEPRGDAAAPPDRAAEVVEWLAREGMNAPLASLVALIERLREREAGSKRGAGGWTTARFAAHLVLARRGSRVALYDLREAVASAAAPLPADALAAMAVIGDVSCLEAIATAYTRSRRSEWRRQLLELFHAIVKREKISPRHAVMKRVATKLTQ